MFRSIKDVLKRRVKELKIDNGLNEQVVLGLIEDFLKQNEFFLCFPKSFRNKELLIVSSKAVIANELNDKKQLIFDFLKEECPDIIIDKIKIVINNNL
jgi:hypothetical protein